MSILHYYEDFVKQIENYTQNRNDGFVDKICGDDYEKEIKTDKLKMILKN